MIFVEPIEERIREGTCNRKINKMRFSTIVSAAVAAGPIVASAAGTMGFALGNKKSDGTCKEADDYEADFAAIGKETSAKVVRIYAASDCDVASLILPAAKSAGFKVVLGIWYVITKYPVG